MKALEFGLTAITAAAALVTVWFARDTVRDSRAAAREQRIERLSRRMAELVAVVTELRGYVYNDRAIDIPQTQARIRGLLVGVGLDLPITRDLSVRPLTTGDERIAAQNLPDAAIAELGDASQTLDDAAPG